MIKIVSNLLRLGSHNILTDTCIGCFLLISVCLLTHVDNQEDFCRILRELN